MIDRDYKVISSSKGKITSILLSGNINSKCLLVDFIKKINHPELQIFIEFSENEDSIGICNNYFKQSSTNTTILENKDNVFKIWLQDYFIIRNTANSTELLCLDKTVQINELLNKQVGLKAIESKIQIAGGNILFLDENTAFIGKDDLIKNNSDLIKNELNIKNIIEVGTEFKNICFNNESFQAHFHLDLFLNVINLEKYCLLIFSKVIKDNLSEIELKFNTKIDKTIKNIKKQLNKINVIYKIKFIPIIISVKGVEILTYSFSNNIVEIFEGKKRVFIPDYKPYKYHSKISIEDIETAKKQVDKTFNKEGIETIYIGGENQEYFEKFLSKKGSLHCLIKVLRRQTS